MSNPIPISIEYKGLGNFKLLLGNHEVKEVRRVVYDTNYPGELPTLNVEVNGMDGQVFSSADVNVTIVALPGYMIFEQEIAKGVKVYTTQRVKE